MTTDAESIDAALDIEYERLVWWSKTAGGVVPMAERLAFAGWYMMHRPAHSRFAWECAEDLVSTVGRLGFLQRREWTWPLARIE